MKDFQSAGVRGLRIHQGIRSWRVRPSPAPERHGLSQGRGNQNFHEQAGQAWPPRTPVREEREFTHRDVVIAAKTRQ